MDLVMYWPIFVLLYSPPSPYKIHCYHIPPFFGELIGTAILILLGDGVVAV
jgi:hypothetical protein